MKKKELRPVYAHLQKLVDKESLDVGKKVKLVKALEALNHAVMVRNYHKAEKAITQFCKELIKD